MKKLLLASYSVLAVACSSSAPIPHNTVKLDQDVSIITINIQRDTNQEDPEISEK